MSVELDEYEERILTTICGGPDRILAWGAWVFPAANGLVQRGLARWETSGSCSSLLPTDLGREAVAGLPKEDNFVSE
jgi:hypothetical protein